MPTETAAFPTTDISFGGQRITVPCQPIAPGLAITACLSDDRQSLDDPASPILGGGFNVTHTPTGRIMPDGQACIECARAAARLFARMSVDWSAVDEERSKTLAADVKAAGGNDYQLMDKAVRTFRACQQRCCWHDDDQD